MFSSRKRSCMALAVLLLALSACRFGVPSGRDLETPAMQATGEGVPVPTVPAPVTPTPTRPILPTSTPASTARLVLTMPTPASAARPILSTPATPGRVDGLPEPPGDGPLPALWLEIELGAWEGGGAAPGQTELGRAAGGTYSVHDLALDAQKGILYALGVCSPEFNSSGSIPNRCISAFDLDEDRVLPPGAVELPPDIRGEGRLYVAGDTLYLHQRWAGILSALDAGTLAVRETISDVYGMALGGSAGAPYIVTSAGLSRLGSDRVGRLLAREYDNVPVDVVASRDRVYVLADGALQVFDTSLTLVATVQEEDVHLYSLALDERNRRLYAGSYEGLYVLDLATAQFARTPADVGYAWALAVDADGRRLFALTRRAGDWFGETDVVAIDTTSWRTETLLSARSGRLSDLVYDAGRDRVLVASADDHALIPIDVALKEGGGVVGRRLPLGIEVVEAVVGDRLYVSDSAGYIHVLDRRTYAEMGRVYGGRFIGLDLAHGRLYAGDERVPFVSVYDARTLKVERVLPQSGKPRANPATGEVVVVNRTFYVYDGASGQSVGELLPGVGEPPAECPGCYYTIAREVTIDAQRGLTATTTYTPWPGKPGPEESIDYDPASGRATYSLLTGGYVRYASIATYPDLSSLQAREQPVLYLEGLGGAIRLDPAARRLYVARGNMLFVLDSETLDRVGRVYTDGLYRTDGPGPRWTPVIAAVDGELGRLYSPLGSRLLVWTRTGGAHPPALPAVPAVVTHTVTSILPSPDYASDGTLLATIDGQLVRSTDRGQTWLRLQGGLPRFEDYTYNVHAAFSPEYATDRRVFAGLHLGDTHGEGVYCSEDGGDTWTSCSDGLYDLRVSRVVPSPNFGRDRTLIAYARTQSGEALYRSVNAGKRWQLVLRQTDYGTPRLPRVEELFPQDRYLPQFRCDFQGICERSDDGGGTWTHVDTGGVQLDRHVAYALSPHYAQDGVVYFLAESRLYRYHDRDRTWSISTLPLVAASAGGERGYSQSWTGLAVAATGRDTHDLFLGSAAGEFYRFAASALPWAAVVAVQSSPVATPLPTACVLGADPRLEGIDRADMEGLGCAVASGRETGAAFQPFERGSMFWREDLRRIYVLQADGTWGSYEDAWTSEQGEPDLSPPPGLYRPVRGFGRVWVLDLQGPPSPIGWGTAPERGYTMVVQPFARGLLLSGAEGEVYALYDDGTWQQP